MGARPARAALTACLLGALALSGCTGGSSESAPTPTPTRNGLVSLTYQVPNGYAKVVAPSRTPQPGMTYDISTFEADSSGCALQVMKVLMSTSNDMEDQDVTYNMVSGMATAQGLADADKQTQGLFFQGTPGPVPALEVTGDTAKKSIAIAGRLSNESLQGFSLMMLCPLGQLDPTVWKQFIEQVQVDGFLGTLEEH